MFYGIYGSGVSVFLQITRGEVSGLLTASLEMAAADGVMCGDASGGCCANSSSLNIRNERSVV